MIILLKIFPVLLYITIFSGAICDNNDKEKQDTTPPVLSITPVDISTVTHVIPFGTDLHPGVPNCTFEYYCASGTQVRACTYGIVTQILYNDGQGDYEIHTRPAENSVYLVIYDHVLGHSLSKGDTVNAGDILGTVGPSGASGRTELQINKGQSGEELAYCPFDFATEDFIDEHKTFNSDLDYWCSMESVVP